MTYLVKIGFNLPKSDDRYEPGDTVNVSQLAELSKASIERLEESGAIVAADAKGGE